jgi:hypothetical protein
MKLRICIGSIILAVGCGEVAAEPIRSASLAINSVDIEPNASDDPYACQVRQVDGSEAEEPSTPVRENNIPSAHSPANASEPGGPEPFVSVGELSYAGTCKNPAPGNLSTCWYTNDITCGQDGRDCGGLTSQHTATGASQLTVGQHMLCAYQCVADAECPAAGTGTARPACMHGPEFDPATLSGQCMLRCDAGETCPDGFGCVEPGLDFVASDGSSTPAPAQCVQFHRLTLSGEAPLR